MKKLSDAGHQRAGGCALRFADSQYWHCVFAGDREGLALLRSFAGSGSSAAGSFRCTPCLCVAHSADAVDPVCCLVGRNNSEDASLESVEGVSPVCCETNPGTETEDLTPAAPRVHRHVWNQPVIWREMRTRAYGRRMIWIKLSYVLMVLMIAGVAFASGRTTPGDELVLGMLSVPSFAFLGIAILSLLLTNAQAVTSLTNERDGGTLQILLVTDLRPHEFILGKIGGAMWNAREMILVPLLMIVAMSLFGNSTALTAENVVYLCIAYVVLSLFAVALGLHQGLTYENSRHAIGHSLGTMFFLCVGIFIFMLLLVEARSSFAIQLQSFILFIGFGSLGLYSSLTYRNPSSALTLASLVLPFLTFYAITDFLLGGNLGVCLWICVAYGFTAIAMMVRQ